IAHLLRAGWLSFRFREQRLDHLLDLAVQSAMREAIRRVAGESVCIENVHAGGRRAGAGARRGLLAILGRVRGANPVILPPCGGIRAPAKREVVMKAIHWIIAAAALAFVLPAEADAAVGDPEMVIYRFPGVADNGGGAGVGVATVFHCTNFSGVQETLRIVTR